MSKKNSNEKVLLAGNLGNIGSAISDELTKAGYAVIGTDERDITKEEGVKGFFSENGTDFAHLVYSVSAPIGFKDIKKETANDFTVQFDAQVIGLLNLIQKLHAGQGKLKSVAAIGSSCLFGQPPARLASYTTAKYALLGLIRSLSQELAPQGIRVNMISPGLTGEGISKMYPDKFLELTVAETPMKRLVTRKDISKLVRFLVSDEASYMTGLNIPLDGGMHLA